MAAKKPKQKVTCRSYVRVNGELVAVDSLNQQQKDYVGAKIKETMLNTLYCGQVEFRAEVPPVEEVFL